MGQFMEILHVAEKFACSHAGDAANFILLLNMCKKVYIEWPLVYILYLHIYSMALGKEVDDVAGLLEKTSVKQINVVSLPDKGRKLDTAEDGGSQFCKKLL